MSYIIASPFGPSLIKKVLRNHGSIGLLKMPNDMRPDVRYDTGSGLILYVLDLATYKAQFVGKPMFNEVKAQTLDVMLMHEVGHMNYGRAAFGIQAVPHTLQDEFEDVRSVENPYSAFYGIPARTSYDGHELP